MSERHRVSAGMLMATRDFIALAGELWARSRQGSLPVGVRRVRSPLPVRANTIEELVAVSSPVETERLLRQRRCQMRHGARVRAVHNPDGLPGEAASLLTEGVAGSQIRFGPVAVNLAIYDGRSVAVEGRDRDEVLLVRQPRIAAVARRLFAAAWEVSASPGDAVEADPRPWLTVRQRHVVERLAEGCRDDEIASQLGVSVRTVRSDIAAIQRLFGVRGRFATGLRLGRLEAAGASPARRQPVPVSV